MTGSRKPSLAAGKPHSKSFTRKPFNSDLPSRGAIDIDARLDWNLATPPPETTIESKGKKLTLQAGTQVLIRMAQPKAAKD